LTKPDFSKIWGSGGTLLEISDTNFLKGFAYLGDNPPTVEEFNWLFNRLCLQLQYLNTQGEAFFWQASTAYAVGDIAYSTTLPSYAYLECTVAGTTAATEPTWPDAGSTVTDGTVTWIVRDLRVATESSDNSSKKVTTSWLRSNIQSLVSGCIEAVATAAGFSYYFDVVGYIKLPSWLGGFIIQWGYVSDTYWTSGSFRTFNYAVTFPNVVYQHAVAMSNSAGTLGRVNTNQLSTSQIQLMIDYTGSCTIRWIAVGR